MTTCHAGPFLTATSPSSPRRRRSRPTSRRSRPIRSGWGGRSRWSATTTVAVEGHRLVPVLDGHAERRRGAGHRGQGLAEQTTGGQDQLCPSYSKAAALCTATQADGDAQDTDGRPSPLALLLFPGASICTGADQASPLDMLTCPTPVAAQNVMLGQETPLTWPVAKRVGRRRPGRPVVGDRVALVVAGEAPGGGGAGHRGHVAVRVDHLGRRPCRAVVGHGLLAVAALHAERRRSTVQHGEGGVQARRSRRGPTGTVEPDEGLRVARDRQAERGGGARHRRTGTTVHVRVDDAGSRPGGPVEGRDGPADVEGYAEVGGGARTVLLPSRSGPGALAHVVPFQVAVVPEPSARQKVDDGHDTERNSSSP